MKPFRWNIKKSEQLGRLLEGERSASYEGFEDELRDCAARVVASSGNADLVFVGRSPESIFDYLSGALASSSWEGRLLHLNISNRFRTVDEIREEYPEAYQGLKDHYQALGIDAPSLIRRERPIVFVDLVSTGGTFGQLFEFYSYWCKRHQIDFDAVQRKFGFLGILWRQKTSPKTWRWWQHLPWVTKNHFRRISNITIGGSLWAYLGNWQNKVEEPNQPRHWGTDALLAPPREEENLKALRLAFDLYTRGRSEPSVFAAELSRQKAMSESWFRSLVGELKR